MISNMATGDSNPLVRLYGTKIGQPATDDEAFGYWVFVLGLVLGFVGIVGVMLSESPGESIRGIGIALAALGLVLLLIGPIIRLPIKRVATFVAYVGALICFGAIAWFWTAFPDSWGAAFEHSEVEIIGLYGVGIFVIALGGVLVPLLTGSREDAEAAEWRAANAEAERNAALADAEERGRQAAAAEAERDRLAEELARISDSQSQFELYKDNGGKHRWRLRHRNRNIIADSAQGYSSRQKAQQGLSAVKRDAFGASVVDLKQSAAEVQAVDEAVDGDDAPAFVQDIDSNATFEPYEDNAGEHRWRLRHDNGNVLADSGEGYASENGRNDAIDRVRLYVQSADYLRVNPAAFEIYRDKGGKYRWRLLHKNGNILADSGEGYSSRQNARNGIDSVKRNAGEGGSAEFEVYEDSAGDHRWRLRHDNGNIIADSSEGYASGSGARDAVDRVRGLASEAHVLDIGSAAFEIYEDRSEEWRWRLRHRNGNILADSGEGYADRSGAEEGLHSVKRNAPNAAVDDSG